MCDRSLTKRSLFFVSILFLLSSWITAFAAPLPCQFYGHLYVNGNLWTDGNPNYHITLDVVRIVNEQEVIVAQGGAEFFMSNAVQHTYTLSFSCDDADSDAIHSGDVCLIYVDGILSDTKPIVAIGWNNVDIYVTTDDLDGDGYPIATDCNDNDASIHPGAVDVPCDGIDQDCDGVDAIDATCTDADGDGH
ncbi:MAG: putative metal-binding motif-containing protein, partial [Deltaproteobacteria bacterium]|nr:putative metal-binding motif-containing protein [Deltaproteobacteria bacterium]